MKKIETDYVVVGAGSAGCVVADRLSASGANVVLLEAGPVDRHPLIHIPAGVAKLLHHRGINWNYVSEPEASSGKRQIPWPRGRVLGGSSSINGMLYVRGNASDFDQWSQMGCHGWSYDEVLPFFRRSERYAGGDDAYRGRDGPLVVEDYKTILPLTHRFVEAAQEAGFAFNEDLNGASQDGVGYSQMTRRGRWRGSTAQTYLKRARRRSGFTLHTNATVTRLLIKNTRCTGVEFAHNANKCIVNAAKEVVVCGGAVNSPHILQVSGIGSAKHLQSIGVGMVLDLPGVGANLSDHYVVRTVHRVKNAITANQLNHGIRLAGEAARFALTGRGALTFGVTTAQVFCRSREGLSSPDLQLLFTPASFDPAKALTLERRPGVSLAVCPVRPLSRGTIMASSSDPLAKPAIRPNYLSQTDDLRVLEAGLLHARRIFAAPAMAQHVVAELKPGNNVQSATAFEQFARNEGTTIYHPVGTCAMGRGPMSVVDERLRVRGIHRLRVADASVMPTLTTGNTNAPTIMIAEKAAQMLIDDVRNL